MAKISVLDGRAPCRVPAPPAPARGQKKAARFAPRSTHPPDRFHGDDDRADSVYKGMTPLVADDIAEIVVFVANRPDHVNFLDAIVLPVAQSSAQMVHRDEK